MLRNIIAIVIAYIMAAPLSAHISMDVTLTNWNNIWTYVIWAFSMLIWKLIVYAIVFSLAFISIIHSKWEG